MMEKSKNTIPKDKSSLYADYDYHDFLELWEEGLSETEIAQQLGMSKGFVKEQEKVIKRDY